MTLMACRAMVINMHCRLPNYHASFLTQRSCMYLADLQASVECSAYLGTLFVYYRSVLTTVLTTLLL